MKNKRREKIVSLITRYEIETQEELNAGIQMKINELASLDNALEVANGLGLEYNNNNIRVIESEKK